MNYAVIDLETTGLDRYHDTITWMGVMIIMDGVESVNLRQNPDQAYVDRIYKKLKEGRYRIIYQNGKFDTLFLEHHFGVKFPIHDDVMLMGTAYDLAAEHGLKAMAKEYLHIEDWDIDLKTKKAGGDTVKGYLKQDLIATWRLFNYFRERMDYIQMKAYKELLLPAYKMYRNTERQGIYIDLDGLGKVKKDYTKKRELALKKLNAQHKINWNSPAQVSDVLYGRERMPILKYTDKGTPSADAKVLKKLSLKGFTLASDLIDYKFYYGATTKFLNQWGKYAEFDGRIHPSFKLTNVVTGRTSCSDPNLQQVPRNKELRNLFTAPEGRVLLEADYSQIELRIAADYANDPTMIDIYKSGGDIHSETAKSLTGKKEITKEDRSKAKAVNFGFLYGMQAKGFVNYAFDNYGVVFTEAEAQLYREAFFAKYSRLAEWHKEMAVECELLGGVANRFGRFRKLPHIYSTDFGERNGAIRRAINSPVQGTASDLLLFASIEIADELGQYGVKLCGTVHDSILIEGNEEDTDFIIDEVKRIMSHPKGLDTFKVTFKVPIEADVGVGAWGSK